MMDSLIFYHIYQILSSFFLNYQLKRILNIPVILISIKISKIYTKYLISLLQIKNNSSQCNFSKIVHIIIILNHISFKGIHTWNSNSNISFWKYQFFFTINEAICNVLISEKHIHEFHSFSIKTRVESAPNDTN